MYQGIDDVKALRFTEINEKASEGKRSKTQLWSTPTAWEVEKKKMN